MIELFALFLFFGVVGFTLGGGDTNSYQFLSTEPSKSPSSCEPLNCESDSDWFQEPICACVPKTVGNEVASLLSDLDSVFGNVDSSFEKVRNSSSQMISAIDEMISSLDNNPLLFPITEALKFLKSKISEISTIGNGAGSRKKREADFCAELTAYRRLKSLELNLQRLKALVVILKSIRNQVAALFNGIKWLLSSGIRKMIENFITFLDYYIAGYETEISAVEAELPGARQAAGNLNILHVRWCDTSSIPFEVLSQTYLKLYTKENPDEPQILTYDDISSVLSSNFNPSRPTRILIHGYLGVIFRMYQMKDSYLGSFDLNIIIVDWIKVSQNINYLYSASQIKNVAAMIARFLENLQANEVLQDLSSVNCVGHSLGAQTCGFLGKKLRQGRLNTIIGLDPAGPFFPLDNIAERLDAVDAEYVEIIHTDTNVFGMGRAIGHSDWYPNGGVNMIGCESFLLLDATCDHMRSVDYFTETITSDRLWGRKCESMDQMSDNQCVGEGHAMGGEPIEHKNLRGIFRMSTNGAAPFGKGVF